MTLDRATSKLTTKTCRTHSRSRWRLDLAVPMGLALYHFGISTDDKVPLVGLRRVRNDSQQSVPDDLVFFLVSATGVVRRRGLAIEKVTVNASRYWLDCQPPALPNLV